MQVTRDRRTGRWQRVEAVAAKHAHEVSVDPISGAYGPGEGHAPLVAGDDPREDRPAVLEARLEAVLRTWTPGSSGAGSRRQERRSGARREERAAVNRREERRGPSRPLRGSRAPSTGHVSVHGRRGSTRALRIVPPRHAGRAGPLALPAVDARASPPEAEVADVGREREEEAERYEAPADRPRRRRPRARAALRRRRGRSRA